MTVKWQRKAQNQQVLFQKAIGKIVSWNLDDRQTVFETNFLGNNAADLRAGVPLIVLIDLSCSSHLLPNFKWNITARDTM